MSFHFRVFTSPSGLQILAGRNAKQNELLSLQIACGLDVWFHADGPGAHVVLRYDANIPFTQDDFQFSANIAASHSGLMKKSNKKKVDVTMCRAIDVTKRKGDELGTVVIKGPCQMIKVAL